MNNLRQNNQGITRLLFYFVSMIIILGFCITCTALDTQFRIIAFLGSFPTFIFIIYFLFKRSRSGLLIFFGIFSLIMCILILGIASQGIGIKLYLIMIAFYFLYLIPIGILFSLDFSPKTGLNVCLILLGVFNLTVVVASYYNGFDLQWGFHNSALTWGLPLLLSVPVILILTFLNIKLNKWIVGTAGCLLGFLTIAYFNILINSTEIALLDQDLNHPVQTSLTEEEKIVSLILSNRNEEPGHFMVVYPSQDFHYIFASNPQEAEEYKNEMKTYIKNDPYTSGMIDKLFELNKQPYKLSLPSNLEKGYYVDYPQIFKNYIWRWNGLGYYSLRWETYHPLAEGPVRISKPYYDPETGLVLTYVTGINFEQSQYGDVTVFSYKDGKIEQIGGLPTRFSFMRY
jgi:hypothetical protein